MRDERPWSGLAPQPRFTSTPRIKGSTRGRTGQGPMGRCTATALPRSTDPALTKPRGSLTLPSALILRQARPSWLMATIFQRIATFQSRDSHRCSAPPRPGRSAWPSGPRIAKRFLPRSGRRSGRPVSGPGETSTFSVIAKCGCIRNGSPHFAVACRPLHR